MKSNCFSRIENVAEFKVIGCSMEMSVVDFKATEVWSKFMQQKNRLTDYDNTCYLDVNIYEEYYFDSYNPSQLFNKLAGVKSDNNTINGFDSLTIQEGRYAIFIHEGLAADISKTFQFIFTEWLPNSNEQLDHRPHFFKLPVDYKNDNQTIREEIYIPLK
jgi:AraC family transcriptional regulator